MDEWQVQIEKRLVAMHKDIIHIKDKIPVCEKSKHKEMIKGNKRLILLILSAIFIIMLRLIIG